MRPNKLTHWGLYSLAWYEDEMDGRPATTRNLYEATGGLFESREDVTRTMSRLYKNKELVARDDVRGNAYEYRINADGIRALWVVGVPTELPREYDDVELPDDLTLPSLVTAFDTGFDPDEIPLMESHGIDPESSGDRFESWADRKRFFAQMDDDDAHVLTPDPDPELPEPDLDPVEDEFTGFGDRRDEGDIDFEGLDAVMDEFEDDEPGESEEPEGVALAEFDPGPSGHAPGQCGLVEAADGETVEFSRQRDDGTMEYLGPIESDKDYVYVADPGETPERDTIDYSPNWEWVGVQMMKLGYPVLAKRAFEEKLTPAEVYGPVLELIYEHRFDSEYDLDLSSPVSNGLTLTADDPDPNVVSACKERMNMA